LKLGGAKETMKWDTRDWKGDWFICCHQSCHKLGHVQAKDKSKSRLKDAFTR